jgi:hypothetical protein
VYFSAGPHNKNLEIFLPKEQNKNVTKIM